MSAPPSTSVTHRLVTFAVVAGGSVCFCGKGVLVKLGYDLGLDTVTVLTLRNLMALPFFLVGAWWTGRGRSRIAAADWGRILALAFVGYYLSSLANFLGLRHLSVGLERMILYTYPSLVMVGSALFLGQRLQARAIAAMLVCYAGLGVGFMAEMRVDPGSRWILGAALVFASAVTYAVFTTGSAEMIRRLGPTRFMSWCVAASGLMVLLHFVLTHEVALLAQLPGKAWSLGAIMATVATVLPSYLFGWGLQRAGATAASVIGMVGPVATFVLAWAVLGESISVLQLAGLALTLAGGLGMSLLKTRR